MKYTEWLHWVYFGAWFLVAAFVIGFFLGYRRPSPWTALPYSRYDRIITGQSWGIGFVSVGCLLWVAVFLVRLGFCIGMFG